RTKTQLAGNTVLAKCGWKFKIENLHIFCRRCFSIPYFICNFTALKKHRLRSRYIELFVQFIRYLANLFAVIINKQLRNETYNFRHPLSKKRTSRKHT